MSNTEEKSEKTILSSHNSTAKAYWLVMFCLSIVIIGFSVYCCFKFSLPELLTLIGAMVAAYFLNKYQFRIPRTKLSISAKELTVFWGILWLGAEGGVFLAIAIALARFGVSNDFKSHRIFGGFVNIAATFAAGSAFYYFLGQQTQFAHSQTFIENIVGFQTIAAALGVAVFIHYLLCSFLTSIFIKLDCEYSCGEIWRRNFKLTIASYAFGVLAAVLIHIIFLNFGLAFGLVFLPLVIFGHFAYQIYLRRLEQKTREITESSRIHLATVEALATAIDARDQVGVGHVRRTQIYAVGIGKVLGLSEDEIQALNTGALLHDIGKLAVPDHILNKPGRLTPAEFEKTKIHASVGASILEKIDFSYPVVPTVKYHHESWDGSGYPEGLAKEDIPLTARILCVADAYDTLRGARPYRPAVSRDEARKYLLNGAGTQFDPKIVDVFLRNLRYFEEEIEAQKLAYSFDRQSEKETIKSDGKAEGQSYVEQIKRANREVFTLYELAKVFTSALSLQETLSLLSKKISEFVPFDTCIIYLLENNSDEARAVYVEGKNSSALHGKRVKAGEGATGFVLKKRQSVHNINPGLDFSFSQLDFIQEYSAMISLPLITDENLVGAVSLYSCELNNYEDEHLRLLETITRIASDAIYKSMRHAETESRALTDPMTQLPNARSLQIQFDKEMARANRNRQSFQILMLDLDGFKAVNDTFGHKVGDDLLREVAKVMRGQLRDYDFLARYAGDEFVAIIPETDEEEIKDLCGRISQAVADYALFVDDNNFAQVGVSVGAASYPQDGDTLDQILIAADKQMYAVKAARKRQKAAENSDYLSDSSDPIPVQLEENLIYELDESHIISSAIN